MDNSISKALIMVASVLLAMLVIAFIVHSFMQVGNWATTQDDELLTEQKDKFNKEYEVYDKKLMYGVDVISCLNKALSNNLKVEENRLVNGEKYDESYEVKVKVTLTQKQSGSSQIRPLEESITVSYRGQDQKEYAYGDDEGPEKANSTQKYKLNEMTSKFKFLSKDYTKISNFEGNTRLVSKSMTSKLNNITEFNITAKKNGTNETETRALLSVADMVSEVIKNTDSKTSGQGKGVGWTKAEFRSALYDLKTRKFKCTNLTYSDSGRVNYIEFEEI